MKNISVYDTDEEIIEAIAEENDTTTLEVVDALLTIMKDYNIDIKEYL